MPRTAFGDTAALTTRAVSEEQPIGNAHGRAAGPGCARTPTGGKGWQVRRLGAKLRAHPVAGTGAKPADRCLAGHDGRTALGQRPRRSANSLRVPNRHQAGWAQEPPPLPVPSSLALICGSAGRHSRRHGLRSPRRRRRRCHRCRRFLHVRRRQERRRHPPRRRRGCRWLRRLGLLGCL